MPHPKGGLTGSARVRGEQTPDRKAGLTGSKRVKDSSTTAGEKAKKLAKSAGISLEEVVSSPAQNSDMEAIIQQNDFKARERLKTRFASQTIESSNQQSTAPTNNPYGELSIPDINFNSLIPTDLINPTGLPECSQEQLTKGLAIYASATRAVQLYGAGFKYIEEVGRSKQQFHKAQQSLIKSNTESVKVQQEIVRFDRQNVELAIDKEKLNQTNEKLKQEGIKTLALQTETRQLTEKIAATEDKRDAEINSIKSQTQSIIQRYLTIGSVNNSLN